MPVGGLRRIEKEFNFYGLVGKLNVAGLELLGSLLDFGLRHTKFHKLSNQRRSNFNTHRGWSDTKSSNDPGFLTGSRRVFLRT